MRNSIMKLLNRIWLERKSILRKTWSYIGVIYTLIGFVSVWFSLTDLVPQSYEWWIKTIIAILIFFGIGIVCALIATCITLSVHKVAVATSASNHKVYVQYGDMYKRDVISSNYSKRRNIVVSVNRCFDTIVDNDLISEQTQHGKVMKSLYNLGLYTPSTLNETIQSYLNEQQIVSSDLTRLNKRKGNTFRYPVGTVAEVSGSENIVYFLLGLSKFDANLKASTTKEEYSIAVQKLIEFCNTRAQGYPVVLPLLGSDMARTGIEKNNILRYLVQAFRINSNIMSCDFHIVVWAGDKDTISINNL